jgi:hypothetical protein
MFWSVSDMTNPFMSVEKLNAFIFFNKKPVKESKLSIQSKFVTLTGLQY